jgi:purine-binding chemotaxis protein CheW
MDLEQKELTSSYLSFKLGEEIFASSISKVLNILELVRITEVPQSPPYIKGVINLRGDVLPVVDTRIKFGQSPTEFKKHTCILVMDINWDGESLKIGALVDSVLGVMEISDGQLKPPPTIGDKYKTEFIKSMAEFKDQFIMILDVDKVFTTDEIVDLKTSTVEEEYENDGAEDALKEEDVSEQVNAEVQ